MEYLRRTVSRKGIYTPACGNSLVQTSAFLSSVMLAKRECGGRGLRYFFADDRLRLCLDDIWLTWSDICFKAAAYFHSANIS